MDTANMEMSELVAYYNQLAQSLGREQSASFKSVGAAKAAILKLEALQPSKESKVTEETKVEVDPATQVQTGETAPAPTAEQIAAFLAAQATSGTSPMNSVNKRGPTQGVGAYCKELILQGKTNQEILEAVAVKFAGTAKTSPACIAFYRNALKGGAASRPRAGKVDIAAMEAKAAEMLKKIEEAKAVAAAKAEAEKKAAEQLLAMQAAQAAAAQQAAQAQPSA